MREASASGATFKTSESLQDKRTKAWYNDYNADKDVRLQVEASNYLNLEQVVLISSEW